MFEFRWLLISAPNLEYQTYQEHPGALYAQGFVRVLQFRTREGPLGEGWWGEWQDVPVSPG